jgi:hypothetical protein
LDNELSVSAAATGMIRSVETMITFEDVEVNAEFSTRIIPAIYFTGIFLATSKRQ